MPNRNDLDGRFPSTDPLARFWSYVAKGGPDECWAWAGARLARKGANYGRFWTGEREMKAHRFSYELHIGPIPADLLVCHSCDNPPCVNPGHLFLGTHDDNMRDKWEKGRNCYGDKNGSRACPESRPRGESSPVAKISDAQATEAYGLYHQDGWKQVELAERFGVSQSLVSQIVRAEGRYTWLAR